MTPKPEAGLRQVGECIELLEYCTLVTEHIVRVEEGDLDCNANRMKLSGVHSRLKSHIAGVEEGREDQPPDNGVSKGLWKLRARCATVARSLTSAMDETITALVTEDIALKEPGEGWKLVAATYRSRSPSEEDCAVVFDDFAFWLAHAWQSRDWPVLVQLNKTRNDANAARSKRVVEIDDLFNDVERMLGLSLHRKTNMPPGGRERPSRADSSSDSGHETDHRQRSPKPRKERSASRHHESAGEPSNAGRSQTPKCEESGVRLGHIVSDLNHINELLLKVPREIQVLRALHFDSMNSREDAIQNVDSTTFRWLFEESVNEGVEQHMVAAREELLSWMRDGQGVFQILGKAGCGKSTLFKLMANHPRTWHELNKWANGYDLIIARFYFSDSGPSQQGSVEGFLRSIFLQILRQYPNMTRPWFPDTWYEAAKHKRHGGLLEDYSLIPVTPGQLRKAWRYLCVLKDAPYRVCFLIDSLDELVETESTSFREFANDLYSTCQSNPMIKACISLRPHPHIFQALGPEQRIHLHDLTSRDVRTYATSAVLALAKQERLTDDGQKLVTTIVERSEGVFVWVETVLRNIQVVMEPLGPLRDSTMVKLREKLSAYPSDIDGLYEHLLKQLNSSQLAQAKLMFTIVRDNPFPQPPNALWIAWASKCFADPMFPCGPDDKPSIEPYTAEAVRRAHESVQQMLGKQAKCLLTMHTSSWERRDGDQFYRQRVQFSHRTVRDFLEGPHGQFLSFGTPSLASKRRLDSEEAPAAGPSTSGADNPRPASSDPSGAAWAALASFLTAAEQGEEDRLQCERTLPYMRLRLAEIVFATKYGMAPGVDPSRRLQYPGYVRALMNGFRWKTGHVFQLPFHFLELLRRDLETTHSPQFGTAYMVGTHKTIAALHRRSEDSEKPMSFLHYALAHGQYDYVLRYFMREDEAHATGANEKGKGKGKEKAKKVRRRGAKAKNKEETPELSLLLSAAFGRGHMKDSLALREILQSQEDVLTSVLIRPPRSTDFLPEVSLRASIPMLFSSALIFFTRQRAGGFDPSSDTIVDGHLEILIRTLLHSIKKPDADLSALNFIFLLRPIEGSEGPPPEESLELDTIPEEQSPVSGSVSKKVPKDLYKWITSPMKDASGEPLLKKVAALVEQESSKAAEASSAAAAAAIAAAAEHPCGVIIKEKHHANLWSLVARYALTRAERHPAFVKFIFDDLRSALPFETSNSVLDPGSEVWKNRVRSKDLGGYYCTRVVSSDGLVIDRTTELLFRVY